ncbi:MAG: NAD(P)/FAD-dependent oxidoreductase [Acidobacteria bacterium]|nr:NAD(P)/FAD-dependent oxidoreductase [Acidobacteriota bacterium]
MPERTGQRWCVLGGGILGMHLAKQLSQTGARVTLCEAAPQLGGLASAWRLGSFTWDRHYHVTLLSDMALRALLTELGLEQDLRWTKTRTGFFVGGKLCSMSNAVEFLRFPPIGLIDKFRLGATILYASRVTDWKRLEQIPVAEWLSKLSGANTFEKVWRPLLLSKLGESYKDVSAAFIWTTISRLYAARRAGMKEELFGYLPGGYSRILDAFGKYLAGLGVDIRLNSPARAVRRTPDGVSVAFGDGEGEVFDRVVMTTPAAAAAQVCQGLTPREIELLRGIRYQGIVCASLVLTRPLGGYYVTNITDPGIPFTGVIEMSALVDRSEFDGNHLVYLPKYVPPDDPAFAASDDELRREFTGGLRRMYPDLADDQIAAFQVSRARHVFALPTIGYSDRLPPVRTSVPGLYILNSAHIVNGTLNVNETLLLAQRYLEQLV